MAIVQLDGTPLVLKLLKMVFLSCSLLYKVAFKYIIPESLHPFKKILLEEEPSSIFNHSGISLYEEISIEQREKFGVSSVDCCAPNACGSMVTTELGIVRFLKLWNEKAPAPIEVQELGIIKSPLSLSG